MKIKARKNDFVDFIDTCRGQGFKTFKLKIFPQIKKNFG